MQATRHEKAGALSRFAAYSSTVPYLFFAHERTRINLKPLKKLPESHGASYTSPPQVLWPLAEEVFNLFIVADKMCCNHNEHHPCRQPMSKMPCCCIGIVELSKKEFGENQTAA